MEVIFNFRMSDIGIVSIKRDPVASDVREASQPIDRTVEGVVVDTVKLLGSRFDIRINPPQFARFTLMPCPLSCLPRIARWNNLTIREAPRPWPQRLGQQELDGQSTAGKRLCPGGLENWRR